MFGQGKRGGGEREGQRSEDEEDQEKSLNMGLGKDELDPGGLNWL